MGFFLQAEDGIRYLVRSRGLGDVYKRQLMYLMPPIAGIAAWLTLGEAFTTLKLAGATITMALSLIHI